MESKSISKQVKGVSKQALIDFINSVDENAYFTLDQSREVRFDRDITGKPVSVFKGPWYTTITIREFNYSVEEI